MIPGSAIRRILHLGLEPIARSNFLGHLTLYLTLRVIGVQIRGLGESDTDVQFVMRLLLLGFETLGHD
jgi:hypothetical protein